MIILVGASASGKTEIAKKLFSNHGMKKAVTHTTRLIRPSETPDVDYHFVDEAQFLVMKEKDLFVETTLYNGNHYGCSKAEVGDEKCIILDPNGVAAFLALNDPHIITFYLRASEETRRKRMNIRGDEPEAIEKRIRNDRSAFADDKIPHVDFVIDCDTRSIEDLAEEIYKSYRAKIA
ncbi:MAG: guanylate kinase [Bacilli bacterium]|nr:guanylate kinase [Bacilli bacterium]